MKAQRQSQIRNLVARTTILTQADLLTALAHLGINVNQATLSRDIRELGLIKTMNGYILPMQANAGAPTTTAPVNLFREFVAEVQEAQNLLVLKTTAGSAATVAARLDAARWPEIIGTVAGDDTVLVITKTNSVCHKLATRIQEGIAR